MVNFPQRRTQLAELNRASEKQWETFPQAALENNLVKRVADGKTFRTDLDERKFIIE